MRDYDILPNGDVIRIVGQPSLQSVQFYSIGLRNHGQSIDEHDEVGVWFDEMRVSDVQRDPGWAARGSLDLKIARDLLTVRVGVNQTQADFHTIYDKYGKDVERLSGNFDVGFRLDKLFNPNWNLRLPLSFKSKNAVNVPLYQKASDVRLTSVATGETDIWPIFLDNIADNSRYSGDTTSITVIDSMISTKKSYTVSFSAGKDKYSNFFPTKYTIERLRLSSLTYSKSFSSTTQRMYDKDRRISSGLDYSLNFEKPLELYWMSWAENIPLLGKLYESSFKPLPSSFGANVSGAEGRGEEKYWNSTEIRETYELNVKRNWKIGFDPFSTLSLDLSQAVDAKRIRDDSLRTMYAEGLSELDDSLYYTYEYQPGHINLGPDTLGGDTVYFDSIGWYNALENDIERLKNMLFWKAFGANFIDERFTQSVRMSYNPTLLSWLETRASYSPSYQWRWNSNVFEKSARNVEFDAKLNTSLTLKLPQIVQWVNQLGGDDGGELPPVEELPPWIDDESGGPGMPEMLPDVPGGSEIPENGEEEEDFSPSGTEAQLDSLDIPDKPRRKPPNPLAPFKFILNKMGAIRWDYDQSVGVRSYSVDFGQADWKYRLGLKRDPGMKRIGDANRRISTDAYTRRDGHRFSSNMNITQRLRFSNLSYNFSKSRRVTDNESGDVNKTVFQYFGSDGVSIKNIPIVNWSVSWTGWEAMPFLQNLANSVSMEHSFTGSSTEAWNMEIVDDTEGFIRNPQSYQYEKDFSPLIGINFSWKWGVSSSANYNWNQSVKDSRTGSKNKTKDNSEGISVSASYTSRRGFRIPIPVWPFKNKQFKNNTTFSLKFDSNKTTTYITAEDEITKEKKFGEDRKNSSWLVRPSIDYRFSSTVTGGFHYEYAVQNNKLTGKTRAQDFGFRVNIRISG